MTHRFYTLDVFTAQALTGNQLAVVLDAQNLTTSHMQSIAREFNLSETVFVTEPTAPENRASIRIFVPTREVPFAGHPTVGTAVLLAILDRQGQAGPAVFTLEEKIGLIPCQVEVTSRHLGHATFVMPQLPQRLSALPDTATLAKGLGLGLNEADIGFDNYIPGLYSAANPFRCVPVRTRDAVTRSRPRGEAFAQAFDTFGDGFPNAYVYCADPLDPAHRFHARMFAPGIGVPEDPATGSAAAAFAAVFMEFEQPGDGQHTFVIEQGDAMGRPSRITVSLDVQAGHLRQGRIGGQAIIASQGELMV
jgi:trans-2,3-dihydro-3-hydroxyanthranilate isomerase